MRDPRGRTIDSLRVSVTDRCNLRCVYCMPAGSVSFAPGPEVLTVNEIEDVVGFLVENAGLHRVRITGGEPLLRPDLPRLVERLRRLDIRDLSLTTNGQLLAPRARSLKEAGIDRVNVSMDSLDAERFRRVRRGGEAAKTLAGIDAALREGLVPVKLNVVLLRGVNDGELVEFVSFGIDRGIEVRFLELMAIGEAVPIHADRFLSMDDALERLRRVFRVERIPRPDGSPSIPFAVSNGRGFRGTIGFIPPVSRPFCGACRRLRLSATGLLRGCLMNEGGADLAPIFREAPAGDRRGRLGEAFRRVVLEKPRMSGMRTGIGMRTLGG
ncbi:MAG: GTP 3',8-cyclase MoaA [Candidatus Eisenbacteria bacterium]